MNPLALLGLLVPYAVTAAAVALVVHLIELERMRVAWMKKRADFPRPIAREGSRS